MWWHQKTTKDYMYIHQKHSCCIYTNNLATEASLSTINYTFCFNTIHILTESSERAHPRHLGTHKRKDNSHLPHTKSHICTSWTYNTLNSGNETSITIIIHRFRVLYTLWHCYWTVSLEMRLSWLTLILAPDFQVFLNVSLFSKR